MLSRSLFFFFFFFNDTATTEIYTLSLHDALPISVRIPSDNSFPHQGGQPQDVAAAAMRSEEHTSELQSRLHLVCRLLLEKKKKKKKHTKDRGQVRTTSTRQHATTEDASHNASDSE